MTENKSLRIDGNPFEKSKFDVSEDEDYVLMITDSGIEISHVDEISFGTYKFWKEAAEEHEDYEVVQLTSKEVAEIMIDGMGWPEEVVQTE